MKQFVLGVPSEEQPCHDDKQLSYTRSDVQGYAQRDDVPESDSLGTPLSDGGAADSEAHGEFILRYPLLIQYELYRLSEVMRQLPPELLPYSGVGLKAVVLQRTLLRFRLCVERVATLIFVRDLGLPRGIPSGVFGFSVSAGHGKGDTALVDMATRVIGKPSAAITASEDIGLRVKAVMPFDVCVSAVPKSGVEFR